MVFETTFLPPEWGEITFTADWWRIEQSNVIGIFGDDNHILLDYVRRVTGQNGGFNPAVVRETRPCARTTPFYAGSGIANPVPGDILFVDDNYINLDERTVQGWDFGLYYDLDDTPLGDFSFRINAAFLDKFFQSVSRGWTRKSTRRRRRRHPLCNSPWAGRAIWCAASAGRSGASRVR